MLRTCTPPISHGDPHGGNVIMGYDTVEGTSLPQIKIIDFGASHHSPGTTLSETEYDGT